MPSFNHEHTSSSAGESSGDGKSDSTDDEEWDTEALAAVILHREWEIFWQDEDAEDAGESTSTDKDKENGTDWYEATVEKYNSRGNSFIIYFDGDSANTAYEMELERSEIRPSVKLWKRRSTALIGLMRESSVEKFLESNLPPTTAFRPLLKDDDPQASLIPYDLYVMYLDIVRHSSIYSKYALGNVVRAEVLGWQIARLVYMSADQIILKNALSVDNETTSEDDEEADVMVFGFLDDISKSLSQILDAGIWLKVTAKIMLGLKSEIAPNPAIRIDQPARRYSDSSAVKQKVLQIVEESMSGKRKMISLEAATTKDTVGTRNSFYGCARGVCMVDLIDVFKKELVDQALTGEGTHPTAFQDRLRSLISEASNFPESLSTHPSPKESNGDRCFSGAMTDPVKYTAYALVATATVISSNDGANESQKRSKEQSPAQKSQKKIADAFATARNIGREKGLKRKRPINFSLPVDNAPLLVKSIIARKMEQQGHRIESSQPGDVSHFYAEPDEGDSFREKNQVNIKNCFLRGVETLGMKLDEKIEVHCAMKALELESRLEEQFRCNSGGVSVAYKSQSRTLLSNLKDTKNPTLCARVLLGKISVDDLVVMSASELASKRVKEERAKAVEEVLRDVVLTKAPEAKGSSVMTRGEALTTKGIGTCLVGQLNRTNLAPVVKVVPVPKNEGDSSTFEVTDPGQAANVPGVVMEPTIDSPDQVRKVPNVAEEDASTKLNGSTNPVKSNCHDLGKCSSQTDFKAPVDIGKLIESSKSTEKRARAEGIPDRVMSDYIDCSSDNDYLSNRFSPPTAGIGQAYDPDELNCLPKFSSDEEDQNDGQTGIPRPIAVHRQGSGGVMSQYKYVTKKDGGRDFHISVSDIKFGTFLVYDEALLSSSYSVGNIIPQTW
eukprot:CAMPEP_0196807798 /NCGR_PEP_ID=MMETSP1362-20130617/7791_1 /TAXON_ID=163516 /ORGANISM="Leptocylindrus danicus, Strain CCMP1856" /LENGTH=896 /DNA_ID=CAMNT_0042181869 /DNA_START=77 /DNA_END=2764 /DNA_ORIENTATION=+